MKTDALITMLARGPVGADTHLPQRSLWLAVACGLPVAIVAMGLGLGLRADLAAASGDAMFWIKLAVPIALACAFFASVGRLARPGARATGALLAAAATVFVLWLAAGADLAASPSADRLQRIEGMSAWPCVASIALLSLPLLVAVGLALRRGAPTRLAAAGACAGALAGSVAAAVYALHCTEETLPFLATWYVLGIVIPTGLGAALGPRFLRWA